MIRQGKIEIFEIMKSLRNRFKFLSLTSKIIDVEGDKKILGNANREEFLNRYVRLKRDQDVITSFDGVERFDPKTFSEDFRGDPFQTREDGEVILHAIDYSRPYAF